MNECTGLPVVDHDGDGGDGSSTAGSPTSDPLPSSGGTAAPNYVDTAHPTPDALVPASPAMGGTAAPNYVDTGIPTADSLIPASPVTGGSAAPNYVGTGSPTADSLVPGSGSPATGTAAPNYVDTGEPTADALIPATGGTAGPTADDLVPSTSTSGVNATTKSPPMTPGASPGAAPTSSGGGGGGGSILNGPIADEEGIPSPTDAPTLQPWEDLETPMPTNETTTVPTVKGVSSPAQGANRSGGAAPGTAWGGTVAAALMATTALAAALALA